MFNFFKKKKEVALPAFELLEASPNKDKYFRRAASWSWLNEEMIYVTDPNNPRMLSMDPWPQAVFLHANGMGTISEYVYYMAGEYGKDNPCPEDLDAQVLDVIDKLAQDGLISITDKQSELPYYWALPISEQDAEKAKKLMVEDGVISGE